VMQGLHASAVFATRAMPTDVSDSDN